MVQHCLPAVPRSANIVTLSALCTNLHLRTRQTLLWKFSHKWRAPGRLLSKKHNGRLHCCQFCHISVKVGYHGWETKPFSQIKLKLRFRLNIYSFYFFHSFLQDPPKMPARDLELRTLTAMTNPRAKQKIVQQTCEVMKWDEEIITWHDNWW